ncbi:archaellum biogenesis protein FlaJ (TadC family) [Sphingomonas vulcanisoli]|uniref:Archaellum biogenesis protein FlaJ (TadC family) n=1 Tax=Sphingomonas vulcanisoli TaxID=1658060 RepID=A0ABX0TTB3_9SPHN|nr:HIG1 domain-containing protein [Sphingomonas vulcanisoli]NIJ07384.1 archaellum biogenesis protein FlaJ (TadC family) [Sphingomonas vulcanisoli]
MQTFLFILIIVAAIGALVSVVRGVIIFMRKQHDDVHGTGAIENGLAQNRMMWRRVQFQAIAIVAIVLFLLVARGHAS